MAERLWLTTTSAWVTIVARAPVVDVPALLYPKELVMQNIHVRRYQSHENFQGSIEPEDRSWIVFVDKDGHATFWRRGELAGVAIGLPDGSECISNEVWYDVEGVTLPSEVEEPAVGDQQTA